MAAAPSFALPATLPAAATVPASVKAALPALTVMLVDGARDLLIAVIILIAGWTIARWVGRWVREGVSHSHLIDETLKPLIANFVRYGILAVTLIAVLGQFGVQTTSLIAILGAAGLAVGLALQGTLSNVASGVMLLFLRPFRVGDLIVVGDVTGTVQEIGLFRTELNTDDGGLYVSMPNATLFSGTITNISRETIRRTNFFFQVDHGEDLGRVRSVVLAALTADPRVRSEPAPTVEVEKLEGVTNTLSVQVWMDNHGFGAARSDMKILVNDTLRKAKILPPVPLLAANPARPPEDKDQASADKETPGGGEASAGTKKSGASGEDGSTR
jgi:small conductance mechanosensitive channel